VKALVSFGKSATKKLEECDVRLPEKPVPVIVKLSG